MHGIVNALQMDGDVAVHVGVRHSKGIREMRDSLGHMCGVVDACNLSPSHATSLHNLTSRFSMDLVLLSIRVVQLP